MSLFTKLGNEIASPVDAAGNPRAVENVDMQRWMTEVERATLAFQAGGGIIFPDKATMDGTLTYAADQMAWVMGDATAGNNGIYRKVGASGSGSWVRLGDLPISFIMATNAGAGTPDAIVATSSLPVPAADGAALISVNIVSDNTTAPVTVAFNGGPVLTIKTMSGNDVAPGGLTAGMIVAGYVSGSTFRLLTDQASAALLAQMESLYAEFGAIFLGVKASPPTTDNDGNTLLAGAIYYNSTDGIVYVFDGAAWEPMNTSLADGAVTNAKVATPSTPGEGISADKLTYRRDGTWAEARLIGAFLWDRRPSVTDYGVGAHGFEGAFGRALSAIGTETPSGNALLIPAGLWTVEETVTIAQQGVSLEGSGNGGSRIRNAQTNKAAILAGSGTDSSYLWRFSAKDLTFSAAAGVSSVFGSIGLHVFGAADVKLKNIETAEAPAKLHKGVVLEHCYLVQIDRVLTMGALAHGQEYTDCASLNFLSAESFANGTDGFLFRGVEGIWGQNVQGYNNARNAFRWITHASRANKNNFLAQWIGDTSGNDNWFIEDLSATDLVSCWGATQISTAANTGATGFFMTSDKVNNLKFIGGLATNNNGNGVSLSAVAGSAPHTVEFHGFAFGVTAGNGRSGSGQGLGANSGCTGIRVFGGKANNNPSGHFSASGIELIKDVNGYINSRRMSVTGTTDENGDLTFNHGMNETPVTVVCSFEGTTARFAQATDKTSSQVTVRVMDASGAAVVSTEVTFTAIMNGARA